MITIVEPQEHIAKLWGKQKVRESDTYRLMRYVLRVDHEGKVLLHNVVTGQLVVLSEEEARALDQLPSAYTPTMEQLVSEHYLVPESFDEHAQVVNLRKILRTLESAQPKPIKWYTILPTTACNARCYYCYEQGIKTMTMSEKTADDVVKYIDEHCGGERRIYITWFGGEPTVAANRIDQICEGLQAKGIEYRSSIATNGYLFDEDMALKAKELWHLRYAQICVDGTEEIYNKTKAFVNVRDNPYQRVMRNIGLLLDQQVYVSLRQNFDIATYQEFGKIMQEAVERFGRNPNLHVNAYPVLGEYQDHEGRLLHGSDSWLIDTYTVLNDAARSAGVATERTELPYLEYIGCDADNRMAVNILPNGALIRCCEEYANEEYAGNVVDGITNPAIVEAWKEVADYPKCIECVMYPKCMRLARCRAKDRCYFSQEKQRKSIAEILSRLNEWTSKSSSKEEII